MNQLFKFRVEVALDGTQVQCLYQMYLYGLKEGERVSKKRFLEFVTRKLRAFGSDSYSLLPVNMEEYDDLLLGDLDQLMKWGLYASVEKDEK